MADYNGRNSLTTLLLLMKDKFVAKVYKTGSTTEYRVLTDNNLTDDLKNKYDAAHTHSQQSHAPSDAQANIIEAVKVNGTALNVENKAIDIAVPLISNDVNSDKTLTSKTVSPKAVYDYVATAIAGVSGGLSFRILTDGEYDVSTGLPTVEGNSGYIYMVPIAGGSNNAYKEYIYLNNAFECIGTTEVDLSGYVKEDDLVELSTEEINALWSSVFSS